MTIHQIEIVSNSTMTTSANILPIGLAANTIKATIASNVTIPPISNTRKASSNKSRISFLLNVISLSASPIFNVLQKSELILVSRFYLLYKLYVSELVLISVLYVAGNVSHKTLLAKKSYSSNVSTIIDDLVSAPYVPHPL